MKKFSSLGKFSKKALSFLMVFSMLVSLFAILPASVVGAENADELISLVVINTNNPADYINRNIAVTQGHEYTLTYLLRSDVDNQCEFQLNGTAISRNDTALEGTTVDRNTGRYSHTFTAEGDSINLKAVGAVNNGTRHTFYIADVQLFDITANAAVDCGSDDFADWEIVNPWYNDNWVIVNNGGQKARSFFYLKEEDAAATDLGIEGITFAYNQYNYSMIVDSDVTSVAVEPTLVEGATYTVSGNENLVEGKNDVVIKVADDKGGVTTYTIEVTRLGGEPNPGKVITANTWDWATSQYDVSGLEVDKTYTLSLYWYNLDSKHDYVRFLVDGTLIIYDNTAQNGAVLNRNTGRYNYTFTAQATTVNIMFDMCDWNSAQKIVFFGDIQLVETDADGNYVEGGRKLDCNSDTYSNWTWERTDWDNAGGSSWWSISEPDADFFVTNNALEVVTDLGADISPAFSYNNYSYTASVPYSTTTLDIAPVITELYSSHTVSGNEGFEVGVAKDVTVTVYDIKGGVTTYTITVTRRETDEDQMYIMRLHEWGHDVGVHHDVTVEAGTTYKFIAYWKYILGDNNAIYLSGSAVGDSTVNLVLKDAAQNGATYNKATGIVTYTFIAQGTDLRIGATMGASESWIEKDCYFAQPALYAVDENGEKIADSDIDCDSSFRSSWEHYGYGGSYRNLMIDNIDYFTVYGDANADGEFNMLDLIRLKNEALNMTNNVEFSVIAKEPDSEITSEDILFMRKCLFEFSATTDAYKKKID